MTNKFNSLQEYYDNIKTISGYTDFVDDAEAILQKQEAAEALEAEKELIKAQAIEEYLASEANNAENNSESTSEVSKPA